MAISTGPTAKPAAALRRLAETKLRRQQSRQPRSAIPKQTADNPRLLHELQVHQIELEMQNAELQDAREQTEALLEKYTDLYDFAPVGYFTLDARGRIQEVNLAGASLLGTDRSRLLHQPLSRSLTPASQADFLGFLRRLSTGSGKQACEVAVAKGDGSVFWAGLHGTLPASAAAPQMTCRVVVSDLTTLKEAEAAQQRLEALAASILTLEQEIVQHKETEGSLKKTGRQHLLLLARSRQMQERLRNFSHQIMSTHDDEHRQISRELYAVISQALASINIRLETFKVDSNDLDSKINNMKRMVKDSMGIVDRFSRKLHPTVLDDLGLIPALRSYTQDFARQNGLFIELSEFPEVEALSAEKKTALYHVVQEALANVISHTHASQVSINFSKTDLGARMRISYNGDPCRDPPQSLARKTAELNLLGMRERLEMVGGSFAVKPAKGVDTTLTACMPFEKTTRPLVKQSTRVRPSRKSSANDLAGKIDTSTTPIE